MGNNRKYNKFAQRKRNKKELDKTSKDAPKDDGRKHYPDIVKENESFETYYKAQNICPPEEWDAFMKCIRENLPTAFRITGSKGEADTLLNIVKGQFFDTLLNTKPEAKTVDEDSKNVPIDEEDMKPVCLPWYPGGLAWQLKLTRTDIRRNESYYRLHNFLIAETNSGNISRQESVSMIPPILLGVKPHHKVLDMCASPGSKTAQLIEFLHSDENGKLPTGFVMANDVDNNRCYMLIHQAKRLNSPCILITNHDASFMPNLMIGDAFSSNAPMKSDSEQSKAKPLKFDRILCDVPCSGDGTLRKNADIWLKWSPGNGNNMHGIQYRIAYRGSEMLTIGGRLAYSTCSLNPLECESVILRLLREAKGSLKLVDISDMLPGLKYSKGMTHWKPASKDLVFYDKYEDVPEKWTTVVRPQMFPPTQEEIEEYHLDRCIRILPHHQDTGGFFVALLEKVSQLPNEKKEKINTEETHIVDDKKDKEENKDLGGNGCEVKPAPYGPQRKRRRMDGYREDPFVFFSGDDDTVFPSIKEFYHLSDEFDSKCLLTRCHVGKKKNIYLVSPIVRDLVKRNEESIKIINTGVKTFVRCDNKNMSCAFRLSQEGLPSILYFVAKDRKVYLPKKDLVLLLQNDTPTTPPDISALTEETQEQVKDLPCGSCVLLFEENGLSLQIVGWRGVRSLRSYTALPDTIHMLRLLGEDTSKFDVNKFKQKTEVSPTNEEKVAEDSNMNEDVENMSIDESTKLTL